MNLPAEWGFWDSLGNEESPNKSDCSLLIVLLLAMCKLPKTSLVVLVVLDTVHL